MLSSPMVEQHPSWIESQVDSVFMLQLSRLLVFTRVLLSLTMKLKQVIRLLWRKLQLSRHKLLQLILWVSVRQFLMFKLLNQLLLELLQLLQHLQYPSWVVEQLAHLVMIQLSLPKQFPTILFLLPLLLHKLLLQVLQQQQLQWQQQPKVCPLLPIEMEVLHTELSIPAVHLSLQMFKL